MLCLVLADDQVVDDALSDEDGVSCWAVWSRWSSSCSEENSVMAVRCDGRGGARW